MGRPLKIAKAQAVLTITNTATTGSGAGTEFSITELGMPHPNVANGYMS